MKLTRRLKQIGAAGVACGMMALAGPSALAQGGGVLNPGAGPNTGPNNRPAEDAPPQPSVNRQYPVWVGYIVLLIMVSGVMGISLIPSKRTHQD